MVGVRQVGVRQKDILLGRGPACYNHPGNVKFRSCLRVHVSYYEKEASHREKRAMVQHLISELQEKRRCRFLWFCPKKVAWVQAPLQQIKAKIKHGLRDARQQQDDESLNHGQKFPKKAPLSTSNREYSSPAKNPATPSQTHQKLLPAIGGLHVKHCSQRLEFVNTTRHNGSERLSISRMRMIPIQETALTPEICARRAFCKYSLHENNKRNTAVPESSSCSFTFDGSISPISFESDEDLMKMVEFDRSHSPMSFASDEILTEVAEFDGSISLASLLSDDDLTEMAKEKSWQGVATRLARPNILELQPSRCARGEHAEGVLLGAYENAIGPTSLPTNSLDPHGNQSKLERNLDPYEFSLKEKFAAHSGNGLTPANVFAGVGSDAAIDLLVRIFCRPAVDNILVTPPTYGMYKVCAMVNDIEIISCPLSNDFNLRVPETLEAANASTKILFICSPGNPTCKAIPLSDIERVASSSKYGGLIVVDEAYDDFSDERSAISLINKYPNIIVLQTLSKAFGLAGIRCGFAIASPDVIQLMDNVKALYNVDSLTSEVAINALNAIDVLEKNASTLPSQRASV